MTDPFDDSRRLTGANLYFDHAGAALEAPAALSGKAALERWRDNIRRACVALGWPDGDIVVREHASGASLAFAAPIDQLYVATEVNEWAWYVALDLRADDTPVDDEAEQPRPHVAHFDDDEALRRLRELARAEAKPELMALLAAAHQCGLHAHADDDMLSLGEGETAQSWSLTSLPTPDAVPWARLRGVAKAVVTGSNGKTTTVRLLAAMLRAQGLRSGYSSTDGLMVDGERIDAGDYSGPVGARTVLRHPRVQAAVLESARGGLLRRGLAVDDARVAVVTNVSADHFGEYGIHTLDDLAQVKLVVAKALASDGVLVLNADDLMLVRHAADVRHGQRIAWFALDLAIARAHGQPACGVRAGRLILVTGSSEHDLGDVAEMPLTIAGNAIYNIANIAAATLAAHAMGVLSEKIAAVLARFGAAHGDNPGRLQRWTLGDVEVLLDYAHNAEGLQGLLQVARTLRRGGRLALILGHAGNRLDADLHALATVAAQAQPDRVWLKDIGGDYLRGRPSGEVADILRASLRTAGMTDDALPVCLDEAQAAHAALEWAKPGDLLVLPVHEPARRDVVVALLDALRDRGWHAGQALPGVAGPSNQVT